MAESHSNSSLKKLQLIRRYSKAEMSEPVLQQVKDSTSVEAILPNKEQCLEDIRSSGLDGELVPLSNGDEQFSVTKMPELAKRNSIAPARYRARKAVTITNIKAAISHYRLHLKLPPVNYDQMATKSHPLEGKTRPNYLPPPAALKDMTREQLSEWKRKEMLKRKALGMKKNRARKREEFEDLKNQLHELVCMAEGHSNSSLTKLELIRRYSKAEMPEPMLQQVKDSASVEATLPNKEQWLKDTRSPGPDGELVPLSNDNEEFIVSGPFEESWNDADFADDEQFPVIEMPVPVLQQVKDSASVEATLPKKEQCHEDTRSLGLDGELVPLSSDNEEFIVSGPFEESWNDVDFAWQEFAHDLMLSDQCQKVS